MPYADLKNKKGNWIKPSIASTSKAANIALPDSMMVSLTDTEAADGYPIAGFTWILMYKEQKYGDKSEEKANEVVKLVWWMAHQGQKYAEPMEYAPLSKAAIDKTEKLIKSVTYGGKQLMK
jgi:phosphate transport system substrate-binding protein